MACVAKYHRPPHMLDENPRKRRKLTSSWDVLPSQLQVQPTLVFTGKIFGIGSRDEGQNAPLIGGAEPSTSGSDNSRSTSSNIKPKEEGFRTGSPPWRSDDKDGHYMFELGENLTPRCKNTYFVTVLLVLFVMGFAFWSL